MSKKTIPRLEEKEILVKELVWVDLGYSCPSNTLLHILTRLSNNETVMISDTAIVQYLQNKGLLLHIINDMYRIPDGKVQACITLANNVSNAIDRKLSELKPDEVEYVTKST